MDKLIAHFLLTKLLLALWLVVTLPIWFSCRWSGIGSRRGPREEMKMITWVLTQEPTAAVKRALEILEDRVGSDAEVMWLCPELTEPVQE